MKTKKQLIITASLLLALLLAAPSVAFAWGQEGHNAIAAIAEFNLTPKTRANMDKYIEGRSIVYYAAWMDWYRHTPKYKHTHFWHTAPVDHTYNYSSDVADEKGNALTAIEAAISALSNGKYKTLPDETVEFHIKILVHAVGDYHCPVHVKYANINTNFNISIEGKETKYHAVWDSHTVTSRKWGYMEWAHQMNRLSREKILEITAGTPRDWLRQTALDSRIIYEWAKPNEKFDGHKWRDFINKATPFAETQIQKAGYRLARVLNEIFGQ